MLPSYALSVVFLAPIASTCSVVFVAFPMKMNNWPPRNTQWPGLGQLLHQRHPHVLTGLLPRVEAGAAGAIHEEQEYLFS